MRIKRYLLLVVAMVGMGLLSVWWKTQTLNLGYRAVEVERDLVRVEEESCVEGFLLEKMTAPVLVAAKVKELGLGLDPQGPRTVVAAHRRGDRGERAVAMTGDRAPR